MIKNPFFTGVGDKGSTVIGGSRLDKSDSIPGALGDVDELISYLGVIRAEGADDPVGKHIATIQDRLFSMNSEIASSLDERFRPKRMLDMDDVKELESYMEEIGADLQPIHRFIVPGGSVLSAKLDMARSICRRAERGIMRMSKEHEIHEEWFTVVQAYINRLSSYLFWAARFVNAKEGKEELHPSG